MIKSATRRRPFGVVALCLPVLLGPVAPFAASRAGGDPDLSLLPWLDSVLLQSRGSPPITPLARFEARLSRHIPDDEGQVRGQPTMVTAEVAAAAPALPLKASASDASAGASLPALETRCGWLVNPSPGNVSLGSRAPEV